MESLIQNPGAILALVRSSYLESDQIMSIGSKLLTMARPTNEKLLFFWLIAQASKTLTKEEARKIISIEGVKNLLQNFSRFNYLKSMYHIFFIQKDSMMLKSQVLFFNIFSKTPFCSKEFGLLTLKPLLEIGDVPRSIKEKPDFISKL